MSRITFELPTGDALTLTRDDAKALAERLWEIAPEPGAAPLAVAITACLSGSLRVARAIDLNEREHAALLRVLDEHPPQS